MTDLQPAIDLSTLPVPSVIEDLSFDAIYQEILTQFQLLAPEYTLLLESDPVVKLIEAIAYRELVWRNRVNAVAKALLLAYSTGPDLDNLGAFYGIQRQTVTAASVVNGTTIPAVMESDDLFRFRIQQRTISTAGGASQYRYWALSADPRVKDVAVYSPDSENGFNMGGKVVIAILSTEPNGIPSPEVLTNVKLVVGRDDIKVLTDILDVIPATVKNFTVEANFTLYPSVPQGEIGEALARLQTAFDSFVGLGKDITRSWIISHLNSDKIHSIDLLQPATDVIVAPNEYAQLTGGLISHFLGYSDAEGFGNVLLDQQESQQKVNTVYVDYAIANQRTIDEIQSDLPLDPLPGVISPTIKGICAYLNLIGTTDPDTGLWLPEDELAFLIWRNLSPRYADNS